MDLRDSLLISAAGMRAQSTRMRVIAENLANVDSTAATADKDPYRRQTVSFKSMLDREHGVNLVRVNRISRDPSDFNMRYDPGHPSANAAGYVKMPNVNGLIEAMDMRQAQRSYEANIQAIEASKSMIMKTVDLLRG